jgi:hypothetical protein
MSINKKQWFDVPDSWVKTENGGYYNVEARFSDHPVLNPEKARIARHNVYDFSIVLHTRVKRATGDVPATKNMTAQTLRFDKAARMGKGDFDTAKQLIARCWDAWQHYQLFREAPVSALEASAIDQIMHAPQPASLLVDKGGELVEHTIDDGEEREDEEEIVEVKPAAPKASRPKKAKAA